MNRGRRISETMTVTDFPCEYCAARIGAWCTVADRNSPNYGQPAAQIHDWRNAALAGARQRWDELAEDPAELVAMLGRWVAAHDGHVDMKLAM
jgi:hypothetical protein